MHTVSAKEYCTFNLFTQMIAVCALSNVRSQEPVCFTMNFIIALQSSLAFKCVEKKKTDS